MGDRAAAVLSLIAAAAAVYAICRDLRCGRFPAAFGAAAWVLSDSMLRPGAAAEAPAASLLVPFALAGVFSREKRCWPILALAAVCLALRWRSSGAAAAELEALVLAILAALGAQRLWDGEGGPAFLVGAAGAFVFALARTAASVRLLEAAPLAAALLLVAFVSREFRARAGLVALVALFTLQRAAEIGSGTPAAAVFTAGRSGPSAR
jgi:hypothetical protein